MSFKTGMFSLRKKENFNAFKEGMRDGIPIGLGYFAVSFSLGIAAKNAGISPVQGFIASLLCYASAGEYAGFTLIAADAAYIEMAIMTFIINARYLLMSCAVSQRLKEETSFFHRFFMGFGITDELFGIAIARPGFMNPVYSYGAALIAIPCWSVGTALGCMAGNMLPLRLVSAFSVALYGMFLAVIIPPSRKSKVIAGLIIICFIASYSSLHLPLISGLSNGTRTILLTVILSSGAAILFPRTEEEIQGES